MPVDAAQALVAVEGPRAAGERTVVEELLVEGEHGHAVARGRLGVGTAGRQGVEGRRDLLRVAVGAAKCSVPLASRTTSEVLPASAS